MNLTYSENHKLFVEVIHEYQHHWHGDKRPWFETESGRARFRRDVRRWLVRNGHSHLDEDRQERSAFANEAMLFVISRIEQALKSGHNLTKGNA